MLNSFPVALAAGIIFGFLSGLGIGGGSLLVMWLTLMLGVNASDARCINLLFFVPCALCASIFRWKQGSLPVRKLPVPILMGCILAGTFSMLSAQLNTALLKKIFGFLLIGTGIRELFYRPRNAK